MKKSIFILVLISLCSVTRAEILAWSVDLTPNNGSYVTAQLFAAANNGDGYWNSTSNVGEEIQKNQDGYWLHQATVSYSEYFFVKVFDGSTTFYSSAKAWGDLVIDQNLASGIFPDSLPSNYWNITSVTAVPEPTSVGLLALGMSALLLRRRRRS
jgi:hypothetical protein